MGVLDHWNDPNNDLGLCDNRKKCTLCGELDDIDKLEHINGLVVHSNDLQTSSKCYTDYYHRNCLTLILVDRKYLTKNNVDKAIAILDMIGL